MISKEAILAMLPYSKPFLFVDALVSISSERVEGTYTFSKEAYFYQGHFKGNPVTPGVILAECMAQIGVVCMGILLFEGSEETPQIALANHTIDFFLPVFPEETVTVVSEKVYYRFGKLKCKVKMLNSERAIVCQGTISGMIAKHKTKH